MSLLLLIEDEETLRNNTQELLQLHGYKCIVAADGAEGVELIKQYLPDLIICDLLLPGIDGFGLKMLISKFESTCKIPFIYLTSKSEREDMRRAMDLGASDYITKPFKFVELASSIDRILIQKADIKNTIDNHVIQMLGDYIKNAKNECNTPLHAIITLTELLRIKNQSSDATEELARALITSGRRLAKTLNNLIDLMRLTNSTSSGVYLNEVVSISDFIQKSLRGNLEITSRMSDMEMDIDSVISADISKEDIAIIIDELTDNAIKFSQANTPIKIELKGMRNDFEYMLKVSNQLTVPTTFTEDHIRPFQQHDCSVVRKHGSGLGLYLVLLIANKYNGRVKVDYPNALSISVTVFLPKILQVYSNHPVL